MKATLLLVVLTLLCSCTRVSPYHVPPGGITVGFTRSSVEKVLGRPAEEIGKADKRYYVYKQLQWVENSDKGIYETLFWIFEFDATDKVSGIATLNGSFFSSTSRSARRWIEQRAQQNVERQNQRNKNKSQQNGPRSDLID